MSGDCVCFDIFQRLQYERVVGFQNFTVNRPYAVSSAVPVGKARAYFAISGLRQNANNHTLHFFAIPPAFAGGLLNPLTDKTDPIFLGATNKPPLSAGVLISVGGATGLQEMTQNTGVSVNALLFPFVLPDGWKILCFCDSTDAAVASDGIIMDLAYIDFDYSEQIPESLL